MPLVKTTNIGAKINCAKIGYHLGADDMTKTLLAAATAAVPAEGHAYTHTTRCAVRMT